MFGSVMEFFESRPDYRYLLKNLDSKKGLWPSIKDNSISNETLLENETKFADDQFSACRALIEARLTGKLPNPG